MSDQKCSECGKFFVQNGSSERLCYNCALQKVTGGSCPEEGDFNTASLISGEMTDQERKWLQEDLRAVETGCSSCGSDDCQEDDYDYEFQDHVWEDDEEEYFDNPPSEDCN